MVFIIEWIVAFSFFSHHSTMNNLYILCSKEETFKTLKPSSDRINFDTFFYPESNENFLVSLSTWWFEIRVPLQIKMFIPQKSLDAKDEGILVLFPHDATTWLN